MGFDAVVQLWSDLFFFRQILEKEWKYGETVQQLFIDFSKAYDSVKREVLYSILIENGMPMKLVRCIKTCLNWIYIKVGRGKRLSDRFPIQSGLK
jgi:hypothetical protein